MSRLPKWQQVIADALGRDRRLPDSLADETPETAMREYSIGDRVRITSDPPEEAWTGSVGVIVSKRPLLCDGQHYTHEYGVQFDDEGETLLHFWTPQLEPAPTAEAGRWQPRDDQEWPLAADGPVHAAVQQQFADLISDRHEAEQRAEAAIARLRHRTQMLREFMPPALVDELERADRQWFGDLGDTLPMPRQRSLTPGPLNIADAELLVKPLPGRETK